jgi:hypothetical protein
MAISNEALYNKLRTKMLISKAHLDEHLIEIGVYILEAHEAIAFSISKRDEAKRDLDYTTANQELLVRAENEGKKTTEGTVRAEVLLSKAVIEAGAEFDTWKYDAALWQGIVNALDAHQSSLKALVQLANQGYFTIRSAADEIKADMATARRRIKETAA